MGLDEAQTEEMINDVRIPYRILHMMVTIFLALIPTILLNLPIGSLSSLYAEMKRKKALANSKVKVKGVDVLLSEKVLFCIVMVPTLWLFYAFVLIFFTTWDTQTVTLVIMSVSDSTAAEQI